MRASIPEYAKPIATTRGELVMSTPAWYHKHGTVSTVLVDARTWPPAVVKHDDLRVTAAARLPDGRWACVGRADTGWHLFWFDSIAAAKPARVEPLPMPYETGAPADDNGPVAQLHAFAGKLLAIGDDAHLHIHDGERWSGWPAFAYLAADVPRTVRHLEGEALAWGPVLYDANLHELDARGCSHFLRPDGGPILALHDAQLVEVTATELVPRLPGHELHALDEGPGRCVLITLTRDDERGTHFDHAMFDPDANAVVMLHEDLVGPFPKVVAFTAADDLVLHDDDKHELVRVTADELAALPRIAAADLPVPVKLELSPFDELGAASRPVVATAGNYIAIAVGTRLRFHSVDSPISIAEHAHPLVGVVAVRSMFAALDTSGIVHEYTLDGTLLGSRPTVDGARSIATAAGAWIVLGRDRVMLVDERSRVIEVAGPIAIAADPGGEMTIVCEDGRLAHWTGGELRDLPPTVEQIVAIAALGERKFACLGVRNLYLLDLALPELAPLDRRLRRPHLASIPDDARLAMCGSPGAVEVDDFEDGKLASVGNGSVRYSSYSAPADIDVVVRGLAFMDDGRLVIALDEGRGNIVSPETGAALKLDPQPGDVASRWIFFCGGQILIAD